MECSIFFVIWSISACVKTKPNRRYSCWYFCHSHPFYPRTSLLRTSLCTLGNCCWNLGLCTYPSIFRNQKNTPRYFCMNSLWGCHYVDTSCHIPVGDPLGDSIYFGMNSCPIFYSYSWYIFLNTCHWTYPK